MPNVTNVGLKPRPMRKVAVIGGGLMGSGIATSLLLSNIRVVLKEINSEYLLKGIKSVEGSHLIQLLFSTYQWNSRLYGLFLFTVNAMK